MRYVLRSNKDGTVQVMQMLPTGVTTAGKPYPLNRLQRDGNGEVTLSFRAIDDGPDLVFVKLREDLFDRGETGLVDVTLQYPAPEAVIAKWHPSKQAEVASFREIHPSAIPADRTFRAAWRDVPTEPSVSIDMPAARDIWRERMRVARRPLLAALDAEYMKALERGDQVAGAEIAAKKQALRDVTAAPAIEAATTPAELKLVWPAVLAGA